MVVRRSTIRRSLFAAVALALVAGLGVVGLLAGEVVRKIQLLETARSDNVQWTLSQAEVEFLELAQAVADAHRTGTPDLSTLRREFDVFYSRVQTISSGRLYAALFGDPRYAAAIGDFQSFLDDTVALIDGSDAALAAGLDDIAADLDRLRPRMREISLVGLENFAAVADARREEVARTLTRLGLTAGTLLTFLVIAALVLGWLYRVSERRASALQRATTQLNTMVETSLDAIVVADLQGRIVAFNSAAERIFGRRRSDVIGHDMGEIIVPEKYRAAHAEGMKRYAATREKHVIGAGRLRLEALKADGSVFPVELAIQSADLEDGEVFVSFLRDISHRVKAEQDLIEARDKALAGERAKSNFLAVMSHELRTPLNGVLGTLSLFRDTDLDARQRRLVGNMEASGALLLSHANNVLDISKYEAGKLEVTARPTDLDALVEEVLAGQRDVAYAAQNRLDVYWTGRAPGPIVTDPDRVRQILVNLVGNAIKFTRSGRITVEMLDIGPRDAAGDATIVEIRVHDTGIGIAPEDLHRIFGDFETGDPSLGRIAEGTGLGLGIVRRLADALGGKIGAYSTPGAGSTFWLRLPVGLAAPEAVEADDGALAAGTDAALMAPLHVLIVEDNAINREVLSGMLREDGHIVTEAHDGLEGVRLAGRQSFDLILMDLRMPQIDGFEAARRIRAGIGGAHAAPIIAVTAQAPPDEREGLETHGMDGWITKPIDRTALRDTLRKIASIEYAVSEGPSTQRIAAAGQDAPATRASVHVDPFALSGMAAAGRDEPVTRAPTHVDPSVLSEMVEVLGPATVTRLLQTFHSELDTFAGELLLAKGITMTELPDRAHRQAGSAGTFGCVSLRSILLHIEDRARQHPDAASMYHLAETLNSECERTFEELQRLGSALGIETAIEMCPDRARRAEETRRE
jgi:PAS domain S-box-containing protein